MIDHQAVTLILQSDDFTNRRGDQQPPWDKVALDLSNNFLFGFPLRIPRGVLRRHTGVVMECLVSNQKEHPTAL